MIQKLSRIDTNNGIFYQHKIDTSTDFIKFQSISELLLVCKLKSQTNIFDYLKSAIMKVLNFKAKKS